MKKIKNYSLVLLFGSLLFIFSCGDDNEPIVIIDPTDEFDARINNFATDSLSAVVFVSDVTDGIIDVLLSFSSTDADMKRVYVTRNTQGQGDEKVDASTEFSVNDKGDGSIDLSADLKNGLAFSFDFSTTGLPTEGTIVYKFWATSGKGDFRDPEKRNLVGPATLTINLGGTNLAAAIISQTMVQLFAPLADGTSNSFLSTDDGATYTFNDGEFAALWDFGYFYSVLGVTANEKQASFASVSSYEQAFDAGAVVDINALAMDENGDIDLNNFFFSASTADDATFTGASTSSDLDFIQTSTVQETNNLAIGDIVAFVDQYGKKGLLKITDLQPANGQFYNQGAFIQFDIKIQP